MILFDNIRACQGRNVMKSEIRDFILKQIPEHPGDVATVAAEKFQVSRQTIVNYLNKLIDEGMVTASGNTRARKYKLRNFVEQNFHEPVVPGMEEDVVWRNKILPHMNNIPPNVVDICQYGFTEILQNVFDHSESQAVSYIIKRNAISVTLFVIDSGIGIFNKLQKHFNLKDPRHALLELSKGKLTSDPDRHSGEGIFFTSRMFDKFMIVSKPLFYGKSFVDGEWLIEIHDSNQTGTMVFMQISRSSTRTTRSVFDEYTTGDENFGFSRTHVPIQLARYEGEQLVSRSQAKRLLARFDRFSEVFLNFTGVETIGQAFADEIFRVYKTQHPEVKIIFINATPDVEKMIKRALANANS